MLILFLRTIILYILVILVMRLMGKRQIGELQPYEFVITIMISDLASMPMQDVRLPLLLGIVPMLTLLLLKILLSQIQLKSQLARKIIDGEPAVLVYKSKINYSALKAQQINIDELMESIRLAGYFDLEEISYAILETNGRISILPKGTFNDPIEKKFEIDYPNRNFENNLNTNPNTPSSTVALTHSNEISSNADISKDNVATPIEEDTNIPYPISISGRHQKDELFLPKILISDGRINRNNLTKVNKSDSWIHEKLLEYDIDDIKKVLIALYDTQGNFRYQLYDNFESEAYNDEE